MKKIAVDDPTAVPAALEALRRPGAVLLVLLAMAGIQEQTRPDLVFVDVGQGDCIHIRTREGRNYLVDGGGSPFSDYDMGEKVVLLVPLK